MCNNQIILDALAPVVILGKIAPLWFKIHVKMVHWHVREGVLLKVAHAFLLVVTRMAIIALTLMGLRAVIVLLVGPAQT